MQNTTKYLVIGATGKTGSRVIQGLRDLGLTAIGGSRNGDVQFDWNASETWSAALTEVNSVYLTYYPDLAVPTAPDDIAKFCALAKIKGVDHITLLSGRGEPAAQVCEEILKNSGLSWTIVRASWFNQNFSEGMFKDYILEGKISLPVGLVTEPFIDIDDIADVVLASLTDNSHSGQVYEVTGPELLSFSQLANRFSAFLDKPIQFIQVTRGEFVEGLTNNNVDPKAIEMLLYLFTEVLDGRNEYLADGVERALGRRPRNFNEFILKNKKAFTEAS